MDSRFRGNDDDGELGVCEEMNTERVGVALTQILLCKMLRGGGLRAEARRA